MVADDYYHCRRDLAVYQLCAMDYTTLREPTLLEGLSFLCTCTSYCLHSLIWLPRYVHSAVLLCSGRRKFEELLCMMYGIAISILFMMTNDI